MFAAALIAPSPLLHADLKVDEKGFARLQAGEESWEEYPGISGISRMIVYGDPSKSGAYVIRVKFSPGIMSMPHFHPEDRLATVIKGTWWTGTGEKFDPENTEPIRP
ncbi:MAG: cupin domain-containing protein, partial [Burkholderiales bacterium]